MDPDNPLASHLSQRMAEIMRGRGEALPDEPAHNAGVGASDPESNPAVEPPGLVDRLFRRRR